MISRLLFPLAVLVLLGSGTVEAQVIIVNPSSKVSTVSKAELREIFSGASTNFKDGSRAVPVILKGGPTHVEFLKTYIGRNDAAFRAAFRAVVFAGQGTMPMVFDTEAALTDYVAATPGTIGYVSKSANIEKVKAIAVK
jgi:ABC-type phosphate transport system substrate-binding protein